MCSSCGNFGLKTLKLSGYFSLVLEIEEESWRSVFRRRIEQHAVVVESLC